MSIKDSYLGQAWLVLALALCFGGALAGVQLGLSARIEENKRTETLGRVADVVPSAVKAGDRADIAGYACWPVFGQDGGHVGWMVKAAGMGYADRIELLFGLDAPAERITGLWVLDQKETPNVGNRIESDAFRRQFFGDRLAARYRLEVVKAAPEENTNQIQAISGATISSESVCRIVNKALKKVGVELARRAAEMRQAVQTQPGTKPAR